MGCGSRIGLPGSWPAKPLPGLGSRLSPGPWLPAPKDLDSRFHHLVVPASRSGSTRAALVEELLGDLGETTPGSSMSKVHPSDEFPMRPGGINSRFQHVPGEGISPHPGRATPGVTEGFSKTSNTTR
ncbi:hypothetical protein L6452_03015 [Arctium lappa]|uniref:Uncharacterized protein n=1 Tax=Arctium lappa TaxID=4217 RepID=A0ACB9FL66_ARCLA|nr:hypothetical protein L6452_03015 [Arctium lappa]